MYMYKWYVCCINTYMFCYNPRTRFQIESRKTNGYCWKKIGSFLLPENIIFYPEFDGVLNRQFCHIKAPKSKNIHAGVKKKKQKTYRDHFQITKYNSLSQ